MPTLRDGLAAPDRLDDELPVDAEVQRLAQLLVGQQRVVRVVGEDMDIRERDLADPDVGLPLQR